MKRYTVEFADEAWKRIEEQVYFIAVERAAPINAGRWLARLLKVIDNLEWMPRRHVVDKKQTREHGCTVYRLTFEKTYLIYYTIDADADRVVIISFLNGRLAR